MICLVSLSLIYSGVFIWYDYKNEEHNGMTKIQTEVTEQDENSQFK